MKKKAYKKVVNSKPYTVLHKKDKGKQEEVDLKCDMCQYTCKKRNQLNKHMNTKHSMFKGISQFYGCFSAHRN